MKLAGLIKMKCCIVCLTAGVTAVMLAFGWSLINTGITATITLLYSIALLLLIRIVIQERMLASKQPEKAMPDCD